MTDMLDPQDFEDTAIAIINACSTVANTAERAALLGQAGLLGVLAPETVGGLGLGLTFAAPITAAAGAHLLGFPLIETLLLARAIAPVEPALAERIAAGEAVATIAWSGTTDDAVVGNAPLAQDSEVILLLRPQGGSVLAKTGNSVQPQNAPSFDIDAPSAVVNLVKPIEGIELDARITSQLIRDAGLLRAAFMRGSSEKCFSLAKEYSQDRVQFRKPLSSNQVLRHRMSRDALSIETLRNGLTRALKKANDTDDLATTAIWLTAAETGPAIAESAIQIFGGMGFTWDVPLHRHLRQMQAQVQYGNAAKLHENFREALIGTLDNEWYTDLAKNVG